MNDRYRIGWRRRLAAAVVAVTMALAAGCATAKIEPDPAKFLSGDVVVGINTDLPGWSEYHNGVWQGFDIALSNWLGEELGFRPRYVNLTTNERLSALEKATTDLTEEGSNKNISLVISNFSINDKRRESIDMIGPYLTDSQGLLALKDSPIQKREDIANKTVCTAFGSTTETRLFEMQIVPAPENTLQRCMERLRAREIDAVSSDRVVLEGFVAHDEVGDLRLVPNIRAGTERYGIGIPNNRPKLCEYLKKALVKFINEEWDQTFKDALPSVSPNDRKQNSAGLDNCEKTRPDGTLVD